MSTPIVGAGSSSTISVVAIGASAGGIEPLLRILGDLPADTPAAVLVVVHVPSTGPSALPSIINRAAKMPAAHAEDGMRVRAGTILVAPPDHHLTIDGDVARVRRGPTVNRVRPAIDPLFQSVALHAGRAGFGVVLSGALDDGAAGLASIAAAGGTTIVQEPAEAVYASMPGAALERSVVHHRLPAERIAGVIVNTLSTPPAPRVHVPLNGARLEKELSMSEMWPDPATSDELGTDVSVFGCPACGGTLWELREGSGFRFRCRIGHGYSPHTLLEAQGTTVEDALWMAIRALDEQAALAARLADKAREHRHADSAERFERQAHVATRQAGSIRELLRADPGANGGGPAEVTETAERTA